MKKRITNNFIIAVFAILCCSCGKEDNVLHDKLSGQWNLIKVSCECTPSDLKNGQHLWKFDLNKNILSVQNAVEKPLQILETGNYNFELSDSSIKIKTVTYDYYFEGEKLFLADHPEVDGPLIEFVR